MWFCGGVHRVCPHAERTVFRDGAHRCQSRKSGGGGDGFKPRSSLHGIDGHLCRGLQGRGGLRSDHYYRGSESETGRDASGPDRECRYIKIDRSADHGDGVRGNFNDSCQPSGCADLCGTADIRLSGGESLWLRYGSGYGETQISGWQTSGCGQPQRSCRYHR